MSVSEESGFKLLGFLVIRELNPDAFFLTYPQNTRNATATPGVTKVPVLFEKRKNRRITLDMYTEFDILLGDGIGQASGTDDFQTVFE